MPKIRRTTVSVTDKKAPPDRRKRFRIAERDGKVYDVEFQAEGKWIAGLSNLDLPWARKQLDRLAKHGCPVVKKIARVAGRPELFGFTGCSPKKQNLPVPIETPSGSAAVSPTPPASGS